MYYIKRLSLKFDYKRIIPNYPSMSQIPDPLIFWALISSWPILVNVLCMDAWKDYVIFYAVVRWCVEIMYIRSCCLIVLFCSSISLIIFCFVVLSVAERGIEIPSYKCGFAYFSFLFYQSVLHIVYGSVVWCIHI